MALATVARISADGRSWPLCSCGWEGTKTTDTKRAWKECDRHLFRAHGEIRPKPWETPTPSSPPLYRQGRP